MGIVVQFKRPKVSEKHKGKALWNENLIIPERLAQDFGFTGVLGKQAHSRLRNCFSSTSVEPKDKSDSGIIEFSFLSRSGFHKWQIVNEKDFDVKQGKLITAYQCKRCHKIKNKRL